MQLVAMKTFALTLMAFSLLALYIARMLDLSPSEGEARYRGVNSLPEHVQRLTERAGEFEAIARKYANFERAYFVGRCEGYGLAREGALKLKEISYIHAKAYPASELKHGPLALIDPQTPTFVIMPEDDLLTKNRSTIAEVRTRQGLVVALGQAKEPGVEVDDYIQVPGVHPLIDPVLLLEPLQYIAYHSALARDCDVDQRGISPRA